MTHRFAVKVFYEDTDMGGIVYYANYLKFIERARSTLIEEVGIDQLQMKEQGVVFAVRRVEADYIMPALMGDKLTVVSETVSAKPARWTIKQDIMRQDIEIFTAEVTLVAIGPKGRPVRLPAELCRIFGS